MPSRPTPATFQGATTGFRQVEATEDGSFLANDALVWGGSKFAGPAGATVFDRVEAGTSESDHGRWQYSETHFGRHSSAPRVPRLPGTTSAASWLVGSEGTLGVVARVCVRLTPLPPAIRTMLLDFMTVEDCAATVSDVIARGVVPAAIEMMDHGIVVAAESFAHAGYPTDAAAILIVEVDGLASAVEAQAYAVEAAATANHVRTIRVAADDVERALLWKGRKSAFGAVAQIAPTTCDCVVPRTKLVEVLTGVYAIAKRHDLIVTNVFHAGDGNLHPLLSFDRNVPGTLERVLLASEEIVRLCVDAGGALSGEHGIGLEKRDFMPLVFTAEDLSAQACVRDAFDPAHRMNPQKVLPQGARCGDFAMMRGADAAEAAASLPEGSWI